MSNIRLSRSTSAKHLQTALRELKYFYIGTRRADGWLHEMHVDAVVMQHPGPATLVIPQMLWSDTRAQQRRKKREKTRKNERVCGSVCLEVCWANVVKYELGWQLRALEPSQKQV